MSKFRVRLWTIDTSNRGRNKLAAIIDDAKDIGVSDYANQGGEMFFTLPWNHPQINEIVPWQRHYEVSRLNAATGNYDVLSVGLIDDYNASANDVIVQGRNYLSLFDVSITGASTSYASTEISTIIQAEISAAINHTNSSGKSLTNFITLGTIEATSKTTTVLSAFQSRLQFVSQLCDILQADGSTRPILTVSRTGTITATFATNKGSDKEGVRLDYGGTVNDFRFDPGFDQFGTQSYMIGQKREGASILYSRQTYASQATYGIIQHFGGVVIDIVDQAALDEKNKREAREIGTGNRRVGLAIRSGTIVPYDGWDIADSVRVIINRGIVNLNDLYTVWGFEWTGTKDGSEDLFLDLLPKRT